MKEYKEFKGKITEEKLSEGRFVKTVDSRVVEKLMQDFIIPYYKNNKKPSEEFLPLGDQPSMLKAQEYVEEFLNAATIYGKFTKGNPKSDEVDTQKNTAYWVVKILSELNMKKISNDIKRIAAFEEELTKAAVKAGFKAK
jgi:hypothetical protein